MGSSYAGQCACGEIRFESSAEPLAVYNCHCLSCQTSCGAPFSTIYVFPREAVRTRGKAAQYVASLNGTSDHFHTDFCPRCGTQLFASSEVKPDILIVRATALSIDAWMKPVADIWTITARSGVAMDSHIPKVFRSPPLLGGETYI